MSAEQIKTVRTRFAPSPTGFVHIGNFRTALFAFLFARHHNGVNILRIEDTDQVRQTAGAVDNLLQVMGKMGITFDEGVYLEDSQLKSRGDLGPYIQSQRLDIYNKYLRELILANKAYYCFCSSQRLDDLRKEQVALKHPPMYDRRCRNLTPEIIKEKLEEFSMQKLTPVVRQAIPETGQTVVRDLVYGAIIYQNTTLDDQVLLKSDGYPTYHLAVVIDDHLMEITHVIRGEEWIPSTPKHILLYQGFGWAPPQFAHLPLILNPDKTKLSKRQGDVSVEDFLSKGYLPEVMINFVALLGWNPKTEQEIFSLEELIAGFDLEKINRAGAVFDISKLEWLSGIYLRAMDNSDLLLLVAPYLTQKQGDLQQYPQEFLLALIEIEKDRLKNLKDINERTDFYFSLPQYEGGLLVWKKSTPVDAKNKLQLLVKWFVDLPDQSFKKSFLEEQLKGWITEQGFDTGSVLWPLRVSLTGLERSPGPFEVASCLFLNGGKNNIITRLNHAITLLG